MYLLNMQSPGDGSSKRKNSIEGHDFTFTYTGQTWSLELEAQVTCPECVHSSDTLVDSGVILYLVFRFCDVNAKV